MNKKKKKDTKNSSIKYAPKSECQEEILKDSYVNIKCEINERKNHEIIIDAVGSITTISFLIYKSMKMDKNIYKSVILAVEYFNKNK